MATIDSKDIIYKLLKNNGVYPGDPQCDTIWSYTNQFDNETQAVFWDWQHDMYESPFVIGPTLLWRRGTGGLTIEGKEWIKAYESDNRHS